MLNSLSPIESGQRRCTANQQCRVIVVDDNLTLAKLFSLHLKRSGFDVRTLHRGDLVIDLARSFRPHFILLDIGLPGLDGYQVAEQIHNDSDLDNIGIIAISAYSPDMHPESSRRACFDYHLTKPVYVEDIVPLLV